jgi:hypothetical protein
LYGGEMKIVEKIYGRVAVVNLQPFLSSTVKMAHYLPVRIREIQAMIALRYVCSVSLKAECFLPTIMSLLQTILPWFY